MSNKTIYATAAILVAGVHHDIGDEIKDASKEDRDMLVRIGRASEERPQAATPQAPPTIDELEAQAKAAAAALAEAKAEAKAGGSGSS